MTPTSVRFLIGFLAIVVAALRLHGVNTPPVPGCGLGLLLTHTMSVRSPVSDSTGSGDAFDRAKAELHRAVHDGRMAGGVHLVVRDGSILHSEAAGFGDIEKRTPFTSDSILHIYSMTKPIRSVAAMTLFERGKFGLDDPVAQLELFQVFALQQLPYTEELAKQLFGIVHTGLTAPLIPSATCVGAGSAHWPQFRGPGAAGVSVNTGLPDTWSATENVAWKTDLPGRSWSSPIVWGERVFLTTVVNTGESEEPKKGLYFGGDRAEPPHSEHEWKVLCLDLATGKLEWEKTVHRGAPETPIHLKSSYGAETPVTDGERFYALFGGIGVFAFTLDGREVWSRALEPRRMRHGWGTAASPVLHGGRLFIVNDNEEQSELFALDAATGRELWRVDRDEKSNWATPFIWDNGLRTELITCGSRAVRSYDLDGELLWSFTGMSTIAIPTPVAGDGLLFVSSGFVGDQLRPLYAIRPGAEGDITLKPGETSNAFIAWSNPVGGPYNPSPLYYEGRVYVLYDRGLVSAYDARTGNQLYDRERLPKGFAFTSSPWAANGRVFCLNEDGVCYVLRAGDTFELLHTNTLTDDDMCMATPALAGDRLLIRTATRLYCLLPSVNRQEVRSGGT